jgi:hypothetical protein
MIGHAMELMKEQDFVFLVFALSLFVFFFFFFFFQLSVANGAGRRSPARAGRPPCALATPAALGEVATLCSWPILAETSVLRRLGETGGGSSRCEMPPVSNGARSASSIVCV